MSIVAANESREADNALQKRLLIWVQELQYLYTAAVEWLVLPSVISG